MENQRVRISKTMLKSGLIKLLSEKSMSQISVYELCKVSEINRTTFYKYYGSPEELLKEIETDFLQHLDNELKRIITNDSDALIFALQYLYDQRELFCILVRSVPAQEFSQHLFAIPSIGVIFQNMFDENNYSETEVKYIRRFVSQGTFSILYDWLNSESLESVKKIADVLGVLKSKL